MCSIIHPESCPVCHVLCTVHFYPALLQHNFLLYLFEFIVVDPRFANRQLLTNTHGLSLIIHLEFVTLSAASKRRRHEPLVVVSHSSTGTQTHTYDITKWIWLYYCLHYEIVSRSFLFLSFSLVVMMLEDSSSSRFITRNRTSLSTVNRTRPDDRTPCKWAPQFWIVEEWKRRRGWGIETFLLPSSVMLSSHGCIIGHYKSWDSL